jgi:NAD(P)-dependent dehydrogenase (short-subunit alcohol dehydrogenase family)
VELEWAAQFGAGQLLAETTLYHSHEPYFRQHLPWRVGLVKLDVGPVVVAHLHRSVPSAPASVQIVARLDRAGHAALVARLPGEDIIMNDDPNIRQMSCDPRGLNVLITDATTAVGESLVRGFIEAGAKQVWAGAPPGKALRKPASGSIVVTPLDVRNSDSVRRAAESVGSDIDVLVNSSRHEAGSALVPAGDSLAPAGGSLPAGDSLADRSVVANRSVASRSVIAADSAQEEMGVNYFGLVHLSQYFAPLMQARAASGITAWVNLLSVYAMCNLPSQPTFSASMAAALSLSQALRAQVRPSGLRVVNVFAGPVSPESLARSVVGALRDGLEDCYPGEVAQDLLARWLESPKALERELAAHG